MSRPIFATVQRIRQRYAWFEEADRLGNVTVVLPAQVFAWKGALTIAQLERLIRWRLVSALLAADIDRRWSAADVRESPEPDPHEGQK